MRNKHCFTADESLDAVVARRTLVRFPTSLLKVIVTLMENGFPRPTRYPQPVGIVGSRKRERDIAIMRFVPDPKPFTAENTRVYMETFKVSDTIAQFMGRF